MNESMESFKTVMRTETKQELREVQETKQNMVEMSHNEQEPEDGGGVRVPKRRS